MRGKSRMQPCRSVHTSSRPLSGSLITRAIGTSKASRTSAASIGPGVGHCTDAACSRDRQRPGARCLVSRRDRGAGAELGVVGWVKNRSDGCVELEAEGEPEQVAALLAWCEQGPPHARVSRFVVEELTPAVRTARASVHDPVEFRVSARFPFRCEKSRFGVTTLDHAGSGSESRRIDCGTAENRDYASSTRGSDPDPMSPDRNLTEPGRT